MRLLSVYRLNRSTSTTAAQHAYQMTRRTTPQKLLLILLISTCCFIGACGEPVPQAATQREAAQKAPQVAVSPTRVLGQSSRVDVQGRGFSPKADVRSHLRKPDGSEFAVLPMLTDDRGEFTHEIDTLLLGVGTHELWVVDTVTGVSSNVARFEVTADLSVPGK